MNLVARARLLFAPEPAPRPTATPGPDYVCPQCKSPFHVDMMPLKRRAPMSDGGMLEQVQGCSVACFECGTVYGIVPGHGVIVRKAITPQAAAVPKVPGMDGERPKTPGTTLDRVMEDMKWRQPTPRNPR